jgi:hypothetical protein
LVFPFAWIVSAGHTTTNVEAVRNEGVEAISAIGLR